ncbi:MAG: inner membrane protein YpjD [Myxococcaceae bacterium]
MPLSRLCFVLAFHAYALGAIAYVTLLAGRRQGLVWTARVLTGVGWVLHGVGLTLLLSGQGWRPHGVAESLSILAFLLVALFLTIELRTQAPVLGAFLAPAAVAVWLPALWVEPEGKPPGTGPWTPMLVAHIGVALTGLAVFAVATGVAVAFLLLERQMKGKRFGLLYERLPSLELLDGLNRHLVTWGFVALSLTLVTGLWVASRSGGARFQAVELTTAVAWLVFAGLLQARVLAGWRGRRVAWLTMAGFGLLVLSFVGTYGPGGGR